MIDLVVGDKHEKYGTVTAIRINYVWFLSDNGIVLKVKTKDLM